MHTQNVKTAAAESSGRWGADPKARLACVIAEQKAYLSRLRGVWELQLSEDEEAEQIFGILYAMSENVHKEGVLNWRSETPLMSFHVVQPWLQAKACAIRGYGETGVAAWAYASKCLKDSMNFALAMLDVETC